MSTKKCKTKLAASSARRSKPADLYIQMGNENAELNFFLIIQVGKIFNRYDLTFIDIIKCCVLVSERL